MTDTTAAAQGSREVRVFISSTFRDFLEERELLAKQVFPALNRRARERGVEVVDVDLRWGVTQEQVEDGHALEICLQEIERCSPYFIGLLGDSYGSLPQPTDGVTASRQWSWLAERPWLAERIGEASYTDLEVEHSLAVLSDPGPTCKWGQPPDLADRKPTDNKKSRCRLTALLRANDLSGTGAARGLGRLNSLGLPVVYASTTIDLACLETLVHPWANQRLLLERWPGATEVPAEHWEQRPSQNPEDLIGCDATPPVISNTACGVIARNLVKPPASAI